MGGHDPALPRGGPTDFLTGAPRIFGPGDDVPLKDALLASMAIPVIFPPVRIEDRPHVDGYLAANLPVEHVSDPGGPVLAVDVIDPGILPPSDPESGRGVPRLHAEGTRPLPGGRAGILPDGPRAVQEGLRRPEQT